MPNPLRFVKYLGRNQRGFCPVCAKPTVFLFTHAPGLVRNHAACLHCTSTSRNRQVALCILAAFKDRGIASLADFRRHPGLAVLNTSTTTAIAKALGQGPGISHSEYLDGLEPGARDARGVLNQDLTRLTFPDASLDLIVSEDVFEHIPDYKRGFRETHRALKPGGAHVFTIPFHFDRRTRDLFAWVDGKPVLSEPVEYHGDPVRGDIPCYAHLGYDLLDFLTETGFAVSIRRTGFEEQRKFGTFDCYTFTAVKR